MNGIHREKEIFGEAAEIVDVAERRAFVDAACRDDPVLRDRILRLLAADAPDSFLPGQPVAVGEPVHLATPEQPGTVIDRYKLLERIGEGGFGIVFMAAQFEPLKRRVALKIVKPGMDSRQVIGRFEAERQALALMDHPNIARVFDAGTTGTGRPYFVMELVKGIPVTTFCEEQGLSIEARLRLVMDICSAVQHAHQKGIIHRDLKPSNILVSLHGDRAVPKVIDFGIAKAIRQELTDKTVFTQFQQFLGTPAYMSPEQAALSGLDVDTRSDIYSLGVLLYELLTGNPPFDSRELLRSGLDEMRRTIQEKEPVRPSTRVSQSRKTGTGTAGAALRVPRTSIDPDLDWIVLKALEKDPNRRYATVNELAADLQRHLDHDPVTARAPTTAYRVSRFYRRHRRATRTALAFGCLLLVASVVSLGLAARARRAELSARREAETARSVADYYWKGLVSQMSPWVQPNRGISLTDAFDLAAAQIDERLAGQPLAEAAVRLAFGKAYLRTSRLPQAESNLLRSVEIRSGALGRLDPRTADSLFELATLRRFQGDMAGAERLLDEVTEIRSTLFGADHEATLEAEANRLFHTWRRQPAKEGRDQLEQMLDRLSRRVGTSSDLYLACLNQLGMSCLETGDPDRAIDLFEQVLRAAGATGGAAGPGDLWTRGLIAATRARMGQSREAEALFREVIDQQERLNGPDHVLTRDTRLVMVRLVLLPQKRFDEAARIVLGIVEREHAEAGPMSTATRGAVEELSLAWKRAGGGQGLADFQARVGSLETPAP